MVHGIRAGLERQGSHIPEEHWRPPPLVPGCVGAAGHLHLTSGEGCVLERHGRAARAGCGERGGRQQGCASADDGDIEQVLGIGQGLFRILRQQEVPIGGLRVEPVIGAERDVRADAGDHVHDYAILRNAVVGSLRAIHVDVQFRVALALLDAHIHRVRHLRDFLLNLFRHRSNDVERRPFHLNVDRRAQAEVQHVADDAAGLKRHLDAGQFLVQLGS